MLSYTEKTVFIKCCEILENDLPSQDGEDGKDGDTSQDKNTHRSKFNFAS